MDISLIGKSALVCGSTQGIGKAAAIELANQGASITLIARNEEALKETISLLDTPPKGQQHDYIVADFTKPNEVKDKVEAYIKDKVIHILINNTGGPAPGKAIDATTDSYRIAFNMHLICNQIITQAVVPGMNKEKYGRIINIISTSTKVPIAGLGVSNTIRGAVNSWSKTIATELAPLGITVNNVLPGLTKTGRLDALIKTRAKQNQTSIEDQESMMENAIPAKRFAKPEEIAFAIAFLASPAAGYITGTSIPVDGGNTPSL